MSIEQRINVSPITLRLFNVLTELNNSIKNIKIPKLLGEMGTDVFTISSILTRVENALISAKSIIEKDKTTLVQQRSNNDSFVACLAMAEGVSYDHIAKLIGHERMIHILENGLYGTKLPEILKRLNWVEGKDYVFTHGFPGDYGWRLNNWIFDRPAIIQINSINSEREQHIVYWDGKEVFDPSLLKTIDKNYLKNGCNNIWLLSSSLKETNNE